jgi:hypothetical protein
MSENNAVGDIVRMGKSTADIIASVIILLISGAGFIGGYFQSNINTNSSLIYDEIADIKEEAEEIKTNIEYFMDEERSLKEEVNDLKHNIYMILNEWFPILDPANNISEDTIRLFNVTSISNIQANLREINGTQGESIVFHMFNFFKLQHEPGEDIFYIPIAKDLTIEIPKQKWLDHYLPFVPEYETDFFDENIRLYKIMNKTEYLSTKVFDLDFWNDFPYPTILSEIQFDIPDLYFLVDMGLLDDLLSTAYNEKMFELEQKEGEAQFLEDQSDIISLGVSVITIAIVLSTTMASRLNEKKVFDRINLVRADLLKNPDLAQKKGDKFAVPVLLFAFAISIISLVWVLLQGEAGILLGF